MQKWMKKFAALLAGLSLAGTTLPSIAAQTGDDNKVDLILDWVPNTNHTGLTSPKPRATSRKWAWKSTSNVHLKAQPRN